MLYSMFIYQSKSGVMLWQKSFEPQLDSKSELFSSFFSAIQNFVKEMITSFDSDSPKKGLESIEMGNFSVNITEISKMGVDIVVITDKDDANSSRKFIPKVIKILKTHKELFIDWDGNKARFDVLDLEIIKLIQKNKHLRGSKSNAKGQSEVMGKIIQKMPSLEKDQVKNYKQELEYLENILKNTTNLFKKLEILDSCDRINKKLKDKHVIDQNLKKRQKILSEIKNTKYKILYFLKKAKSAITNAVEHSPGKNLSEIDYKDGYINLYSFSTKLKFIGNVNLSQKYRKIAKYFIDKPEEVKSEFSTMISDILSLPDDINFYIKK